MSREEHKVIWLQPWCIECDRSLLDTEGREWCQDQVWDNCECGAKPIKYILAPAEEVPK